jgi:hypothetical protein
MSIQQAIREYDAISEEEEAIPTHAIVRIKKVINSNMLLVERL